MFLSKFEINLGQKPKHGKEIKLIPNHCDVCLLYRILIEDFPLRRFFGSFFGKLIHTRFLRCIRQQHLRSDVYCVDCLPRLWDVIFVCYLQMLEPGSTGL